MSVFADRIRDLLKGVFSREIDRLKDFFQKPDSLLTLTLVSVSLIDPILSMLRDRIGRNASKEDLSYLSNPLSISDEDAMLYEKRNLKDLLGYVSNDISESTLGDILLACEDPDLYADRISSLYDSLNEEEFSTEEYVSKVREESDLDSSSSSVRMTKRLESIINSFKSVLPWLFLVYVVATKTRDFLTETDYPSKYRARYLRRIITYVNGIVSREMTELTNLPDNVDVSSTLSRQIEELQDIKETLFTLDAIISGAVLATTVYLTNRRLHQQHSLNELEQRVSTLSCSQLEDVQTDEELSTGSPLDIDGLLNNNTNLSGFTCPVSPDDIVVPQVPYELKLEGFTCEIPTSENRDLDNIEDGEFNVTSGTGIEVGAIFENKSEKEFNILVSPGDIIDGNSIIGTLEGARLYSPVSGIVSTIDTDKIIVSDVYDAQNTVLDSLVKEVGDLYSELADTKNVIRDFYVEAIYPVMLYDAGFIDVSTSNLTPAQKTVIQRNRTEDGRKKILYWNSGVVSQWNVARNDSEELKDDYLNSMEKLSGKDNVKKRSENEELEELREEIDNRENIFFRELRDVGESASNRAEVTFPLIEEYVLIEYYLDLLSKLNSYENDNELVDRLVNIIENIVNRRIFIDDFKFEKMVARINDKCEELSKGTYFQTTPDFYEELEARYDNGGNRSVDNYLKNLSKNNDERDTFTDSLIRSIKSLFNITLKIEDRKKGAYVPEEDSKQALTRESAVLSDFWNNTWKRYIDLPRIIEDKLKVLDEVGETYIPYSLIEIDREEWRYYGIGNERTCPEPDTEEDNPYETPFTEEGFDSYRYWLKYCSFATLTSVTNPISGWSTGIPPPFGPIPLPVIYIPIKSFQFSWGFILIGLSICGIYPFPFLLVTNYSTNYNVPFVDPAGFIRKQVSSLKRTISQELRFFRKETLTSYLRVVEKDLQNVQNDIDQLKEERRLHRLDKPQRNRTSETEQSYVVYLSKLEDWKATQTNYTVEITQKRTERYELQVKHKIVKDALLGGDVEEIDDQEIQSIKSSEEQIDEKFSGLRDLLDSINSFLRALPVSTEPESTNFGPSIKNPKPIINIEDNIDQTIDYAVLNNFTEKKELSNEELVRTGFRDKLETYSSYLKGLSGISLSLIKKDPYPKYENLRLQNLQWVNFLYNDWTPTGAKTFGIPGFRPFPGV